MELVLLENHKIHKCVNLAKNRVVLTDNRVAN